MFGPEVDQEIRDHAGAMAPHECCGIVAGGKYIRLQNKARNSKEAFLLPKQAYTHYGEIEAVVHSHVYPPNGPEPSALDIESMLGGVTTKRDGVEELVHKHVPWAIAAVVGKQARAITWFGPHTIDESLVDERGRWIPRSFLHGVRDCFSCARAVYWQNKDLGLIQSPSFGDRKVLLPDVPRDVDWWKPRGEEPAKDLIRQGFIGHGFKEYDKALAQPGDVLVMQIRASVWNHCSVMLDRGLIAHHPGGRFSGAVMSRIEPLGAWSQFVKAALRCEVA